MENELSKEELIKNEIQQIRNTKFHIENITLEEKFVTAFVNNFGYGSLALFIKKYPEFFEYLIHVNEDFLNEFINCMDESEGKDDQKFRQAVKRYFTNTYGSYRNVFPNWIDTMNFKVLHTIRTADDIMNYDDNTILINFEQSTFIKLCGIDNLKRLQESTLIFSGGSTYFGGSIKNFDILVKNFSYYFANYKIFKDKIKSYETFENEIAKYIDLLKSNNIFLDYEFIEGEFRERHPEIFMDKNAPKELIEAFYSNKITEHFLFNHYEYIPYLLDKNLYNIIKLNIVTYGLDKDEDFTTRFINKFGNEKFLNLIVKYGDALKDIDVEYPQDETEESVIDAVEEGIYNRVLSRTFYYRYLENIKTFKEKYPELFVDFSSLDDSISSKLENNFYTFGIYPIDIYNNPQLVELLKDKNLKCCFAKSNHFGLVWDANGQGRDIFFLDLIDIVGNEGFLKLCEKYGNYIYQIFQDLYSKINVYKTLKNDEIVKYEKDSYSYEYIDKLLEDILSTNCLEGKIRYEKDNAPQFLKERYPQLFLSDDAPEILKKYFYNEGFTFFDLNNNTEWLPYLKGKSIKSAILRKSIIDKNNLPYYFEQFGEGSGIKLGIKKPETIAHMICSFDDINLMKKWYDKTGGKFIPDVVVMRNIPIEESDKFLSNTKNWNKLMKLDDFSEKYEVREAMLKLAYSFGVFDNDKRGFNKVYELLTGLPKTIDERTYIISNDYNLKDFLGEDINNIDKFIEIMSILPKMYSFEKIYSQEFLLELVKSLRKENLNIDYSKGLISQIYKKVDDNTYKLVLNQQNYPKTTKCIREILLYNDAKLFTPDRVHGLFGGFKIEYNPEFREFLLNNLDEIFSNLKYQTYLAAIQKRFKEIKIANSNRKLTLDLAISYVQENKYEDVEVGNEMVAEISAIAGYTQEDFDTLQKIYNYGKQRAFSSIPRIENKVDNYNYEMLRLDDPLALAIGTLTDCCQEIGNAAEMCMEHSMVDKNGRVFVIRDKEGNIISQSWVWRNKNVLCFDNIEIPRKVFERSEDRRKIAEKVYEIYKKAANELIQKDEEVYKRLLEEGKITKEQYEGLVLSKVTVGIGYNDIASAIKRNAKEDSNVSKPLPFEAPIKLNQNLYTNDSTTQYILEERKRNKEYKGETIQVHNDLYEIYDDSNFTKRELLMLGKLELLHNQYSNISNIDYKNENIVDTIADLYDFYKDKTKIIMNANFAIIYEESDDKIVIGDLFYNIKAKDIDIENKVLMQIRLAIEQIKNGKEIDITKLEENQKNVYNKAINLKVELDIEKGIVKK